MLPILTTKKFKTPNYHNFYLQIKPKNYHYYKKTKFPDNFQKKVINTSNRCKKLCLLENNLFYSLNQPFQPPYSLFKCTKIKKKGLKNNFNIIVYGYYKFRKIYKTSLAQKNAAYRYAFFNWEKCDERFNNYYKKMKYIEN